MKDEKIDNLYLRTIVIILSTTILTLFGINYIPFILIIFPVLFISNSIQNGLLEGTINMLITLIIISIIESLNTGVFLALTFLPFTIVISALIKYRKGNTKILVFSSMSFFISILIMMEIIRFLGVDVVKIIEGFFKYMIDAQLDSFENMGLGNYEFFRIKELLEEIYKKLLLIIPSMFLILSFIVSYINYSLSGIILRRLGIQLANVPKFSNFSLPSDVILGSVFMFGVAFSIGQLGFDYYKTVVMNIGSLLMMSLFIQGVSVADYFLNRLRFKLIFKIVFYITFIFNPTIVSIIVIIGFIDLIFNLRKIRKKRSL